MPYALSHRNLEQGVTAMHIKQSKGIFIFISGFVNIPTALMLVIWVRDGTNRFIEAGGFEVLIMTSVLTVFVFLLIDKSIELHKNYIKINRMRLFGTIIKIKDIRFVRLGNVLVAAGGVGIPSQVLVFHTKYDKKRTDSIVGDKAKVVDLNFKPEDRERIYRYFEDKKLLENRERFDYGRN